MRDPLDMYFKLVGRVVTPTTLEDWAGSFERDQSRRVALTQVGPWVISTVFLGLNHRFYGDGPPIVFETMIYTAETFPHDFFGRIEEHSDWTDYQTRCATWEQAEAMHMAAYVQANAWLTQVDLLGLDIKELVTQREEQDR